MAGERERGEEGERGGKRRRRSKEERKGNGREIGLGLQVEKLKWGRGGVSGLKLDFVLKYV